MSYQVLSRSTGRREVRRINLPIVEWEPPPLFSRSVAIIGGSRMTLGEIPRKAFFLNEGKVFELDHASGSTATIIPGVPAGVVQIAGNYMYLFAVCEDGSVWQYGKVNPSTFAWSGEWSKVTEYYSVADYGSYPMWEESYGSLLPLPKISKIKCAGSYCFLWADNFLIGCAQNKDEGLTSKPFHKIPSLTAIPSDIGIVGYDIGLQLTAWVSAGKGYVYSYPNAINKDGQDLTGVSSISGLSQIWLVGGQAYHRENWEYPYPPDDLVPLSPIQFFGMDHGFFWTESGAFYFYKLVPGGEGYEPGIVPLGFSVNGVMVVASDGDVAAILAESGFFIGRGSGTLVPVEFDMTEPEPLPLDSISWLWDWDWSNVEYWDGPFPYGAGTPWGINDPFYDGNTTIPLPPGYESEADWSWMWDWDWWPNYSPKTPWDGVKDDPWAGYGP